MVWVSTRLSLDRVVESRSQVFDSVRGALSIFCASGRLAGFVSTSPRLVVSIMEKATPMVVFSPAPTLTQKRAVQSPRPSGAGEKRIERRR